MQAGDNNGLIKDLGDKAGMPNPGPITCERSNKFTVELTNLLEGGEIPGNVLIPHLSVRIYTDQGILVDQIDEFNEFSFHDDESGVPVFRQTETYNYDIRSVCLDGASVIIYDIQLLALEDGEYIPYPIHSNENYYGPDGVYSCEYFSLTHSYCDPYNSPAQNADYPTLYEIDHLLCGCAYAESREVLIPTTNNYEVYPNPFVDQTILSLNMSTKDNVQVIIYDSTGKVVQRWNETYDSGRIEQVLNTETWTSGLYFIQIRTDKETQALKLIKS